MKQGERRVRGRKGGTEKQGPGEETGKEKKILE